MKRIFTLLFAFMMVFGLTVSAHATLIDNGNGTVTQNRDDGTALLWLQDANYANTSGYDTSFGGRMNWFEQNAWITSLNAENGGAGHLGYNDWRLPETNPVNGISYNYTGSHDGTSDMGSNMSAPGTLYENSYGSEMANLYYSELGNISYWDTSGNPGQLGYGLSNTGPFINLQASLYWSGTEYAPNTTNAWFFGFELGQQFPDLKSNTSVNEMYALAVRDAEPVPEPTTIALLGIGLVGLAGAGVRRRRKSKAVDKS